jgi:hypothetical protein
MIRNFKLEFNPQIHTDIQQQVDYYKKETKSQELGKRFAQTVKTEVLRLKKHALQYEVKYDDVRCLPIPKFPFRAHYRVNENDNIVKIEAIISTSENPSKWIK